MKSRSLLRILLVAGIVVLAILYWQRNRAPEVPPTAEVPTPQIQAPTTPEPPKVIGDEKIAPAPLKKGSRVFYGMLPQTVPSIDKLPMANQPSKEWQKRLQTNLKRIGGTRLKSAEVTPQESYIIPDGNSGRYVERVVVKVKGNNGEYTSFFAEVDSETGHVLKSWGAAIQEKNRRHQH